MHVWRMVKKWVKKKGRETVHLMHVEFVVKDRMTRLDDFHIFGWKGVGYDYYACNIIGSEFSLGKKEEEMEKINLMI